MRVLKREVPCAIIINSDLVLVRKYPDRFMNDLNHI